MTNITITLRLPIQYASECHTTEIVLQPCSPACLLHESAQFTFGMPRPGAKGNLFVTTAQTIIKPRLHQQTGDHASLFALPFDHAAQQRAFAALRKAQLPSVALPLRECACSYELGYVPAGLVIYPTSAWQARWIKPKYPAHTFATKAAALAYLAQAANALQQLHRLGIWHGDVNFTNCLWLPDETASRVCWIDLNCTLHLGFCARAEYVDFVRHCLWPVLRDHADHWQCWQSAWQLCQQPHLCLLALCLNPLQRGWNLINKIARKFSQHAQS